MNVFSPNALAGKVAVVTGAARGIGRCTAIALARAGADVGLTSAPSPAPLTIARSKPAAHADIGTKMAPGQVW